MTPVALPDPPLHGEGDRAQRGGGGAKRAIRPDVALARRQRRRLSLPEVLLWQRLRRNALGARVRNQHPIGPYVVDFYIAALRLVIEVDGQVHASPAAIAHDCRRDQFLAGNGYRVLRIDAAEILQDADAVASSIASLAGLPLHQPAAGPPPRSGEDLSAQRRADQE
ncbi:endonuclease domain-containing protein [uncultured Sphingomonas sp.]|uniref:endonuclease domain-containing protein n=1 Tax=uncultured Sphingomonas sp. TaxID=158754 RepID=UPI0025F9A8CF|nr:endonuclease domain-containing protein [uncultured Sphingomonas sp.]